MSIHGMRAICGRFEGSSRGYSKQHAQSSSVVHSRGRALSSDTGGGVGIRGPQVHPRPGHSIAAPRNPSVLPQVPGVDHTIDPDLWRTAGGEAENPRHFVDMDGYGPYPFTELPHDYDAAVAKYGK